MAADMKPVVKNKEKKYCVKTWAVGLKTCFKLATENAAYIRDVALYKLAGKHSVAMSVKPSKSLYHKASHCVFTRQRADTECCL